MPPLYMDYITIMLDILNHMRYTAIVIKRKGLAMTKPNKIKHIKKLLVVVGIILGLTALINPITVDVISYGLTEASKFSDYAMIVSCLSTLGLFVYIFRSTE